jgi:hypothetical protein
MVWKDDSDLWRRFLESRCPPLLRIPQVAVPLSELTPLSVTPASTKHQQKHHLLSLSPRKTSIPATWSSLLNCRLNSTPPISLSLSRINRHSSNSLCFSSPVDSFSPLLHHCDAFTALPPPFVSREKRRRSGCSNCKAIHFFTRPLLLFTSNVIKK